MSEFLTIGGTRVPIAAPNGADEEYQEYGGEVVRSFSGSLLSTVKGRARVWRLQTPPLPDSEAQMLAAVLAHGSPLLCSGALIGSDAVSCYARGVRTRPVAPLSRLRRVVEFELHEAAPMASPILFRLHAGEPLAAGMSFSRASTAWYFDRDGILREAGPGVPRIDWSHGRPALRLEPQRTNQIRNPRCEGAVIGVVGSGGALPTFWSLFSPGLAVEVVGTGTEDGMSYVDVRLAGTPTATTGALIVLDGGDHASAAAGEVWTGSLYARLVAGSLSGALGVQIELSERDASGAALQTHRGNIAVTDLPRLSVARHVHTATLVQAATAAVRALLRVPVTQGVPVDLTLRLAGPQLERGPYPSSLILPDVGAPAVSTRARETVSADVSALNPPRAIAVYMRCIKGYDGDGGHSAPRLWTVSDSDDTPPRATVYVGSVGLLRFSHRTSPSAASDAGVVGSETARGDQVEALAILHPDGAPSLGVSINGGPTLSGSSGPLAFAQAWSAARIHIAGPFSSGPLDVRDLLVLDGSHWTMDAVRRLVR